MTEVVDVLVPCEPLSATARLGPEDHLTELEKLVLRAIGEGVNTVPTLADLFGLGQRLTLDLVFDLWRPGLLTVDVTHGRVGLSTRAAKAVAEEALDTLASSEARDERLPVLQEQLTGHVLDPRSVPRPQIDPRAIIPVALFEVGPQDISRRQLVEALRSITRRQGDDRRALKVLAADLAWDNMRPQGERRMLRLRVRPRFDPDSARLSVDVLPDASIPAHVRARMADRIALVVEGDPDARFSRSILSAADDERAPTIDLDVEVARLVERVAKLEPTTAASLNHDELVELADRVQARASDLASAACDVGLVAGRAAQSEALNEIVGRARRQLVIVSPWLGDVAVRGLAEGLEQALTRGVQVFVLWGISPDSTPADSQSAQSAFNLLADLSDAHAGRLTISRRSARTHAKLAIADDRLALVTSRNLLSGRFEGDFELGLRVTGRPDEASPILEELLAWARGTMPEYVQAQALYQNAEDFELGDEARGRRPPPVSRGAIQAPEPPRSTTDDVAADPRFADAILEAWMAGWRHHANQLQLLARASQDGAAHVVRDGEHRDLLWQGLRAARRRLLIASDGLAARVIDGAWLSTLADRIADDVAIALVWSKSGEEDEDAVRRLNELAQRSQGRLILIAEAATHAKVIIVDETIVATSFNPLSFDGLYKRPGSPGWRRDRSELGVRVQSAALTDEAIAAIGTALDADLSLLLAGARPGGPRQQLLLDQAPLAPEIAGLVRALAEAADAGAMHRLLRRAFDESADAESLIDRLHQTSLPSEARRMATATFVLSAGARGAEADGWRAWLAHEAWQRGALLEAAIIADSVGNLPSPVLAPSVTASWSLMGHDGFDEAIADAALEVERDIDLVGLIAVATTALILHGHPGAADVLDAYRSDAPWQTVADLAVAHWHETYTAMPIARIEADLGQAANREAQGRARDALLEALDKGDKEFTFAAGRETRALLYAGDGVLGTLRAAVLAGDHVALRRWVDANRRVNLDVLMDKTTLDAMGDTSYLLRGGKRRTYRARLEAIWKAAIALAAAVGPAATHDDTPIAATAVAVADGLRAEWPALEAEAATPSPAAPLLRRLLASLAPVRQWRT